MIRYILCPDSEIRAIGVAAMQDESSFTIKMNGYMLRTDLEIRAILENKSMVPIR